MEIDRPRSPAGRRRHRPHALPRPTQTIRVPVSRRADTIVIPRLPPPAPCKHLRRLLPLARRCALLLLAPAHAAQPLVTETADVIGAGKCQLETTAASLRESGAPAQTLADAVVSCGVAGRHEFGLTLAALRAEGATDQLVGLKGKTVLADAKDGGTALSLAYSLFRSQEADQGWNPLGARLYGVASRELTKDLSGHLNLGWLRTGRNSLNHTTWSMGIEGDGRLGWAADLFGDDRSAPWLSGGVKMDLAERLGASLSYARQFDASRAQLWTLGLTIDFY